MCGGCSRKTESDEWSGLLAGRRARWEAVRLVNQVLRDSGRTATVSATPGAFVVRSATGRSDVVDTAGQLWRALLRQPGPPLRHPTEDDVLRTPVADAVLAALLATDETSRSSTGRTAP
jgi:hypothetical protein